MTVRALKHIFGTPIQIPLHIDVLMQRVIFAVAFTFFLIIQWQSHIYLYQRDILITDFLVTTLKALLFVLLFIKLIVQRYDLIRLILISAIAFFLLFSAVRSHDKTALWTFLFIISAQNVDWKTVGWSGISATSSIILLDASANFMGRSVEYIDSRDLHDLRFSLGFSHPNLTALFVFLFVMSVYLIWRKHIVLVGLTILGALAIIVILLRSRTEVIGLLVLLLLLPLNYLQKRCPRSRFLRFINYCICIGCDLICIISFLASYYFEKNSSVFLILDKLFSGRLDLLHGYLHGGGLTLFGRTYSDFSTGMVNSFGSEVSFLADNFYVRSILLYGVIVGGIVVISFLVIQWELAKNNSEDFYPFSVPLIMGIAESLALFADKNLMIFVFSRALYKGLEQESLHTGPKHKLS